MALNSAEHSCSVHMRPYGLRPNAIVTRPYPKQRCRATQFVSQPFLVGDRVDIATSSGSKALSGTVERIDPMRTILRTDHDVPITIPNKASGACAAQDRKLSRDLV